jgi:aryl carrier-like protein
MELGEIEAALGAHESVAMCAVVAVRNPHGLVNRLVAHVVPSGPGHDTAALTQLWRTHLRRAFGGSLPPLTYRIVRDLPRNAGGKVDRRRLTAPDATGRAPGVAAPTAAERRMASLWTEFVGARPLAADDSFFAVGGTSISLVQLLHRIRDRLGVRLSLRDCYSNPTLSGMAALVTVPDHPREALP